LLFYSTTCTGLLQIEKILCKKINYNTGPEPMEEQTKIIESLISSATQYAKTSFDLVKLNAIEKTVDTTSSIVPTLIAISLFVTFLLFVNLGLSLWLGEILGNTFYGFLIVGGFYGVASLLIYLLFFEAIKKRIGNIIVKQLFK
jgi:hypothetical protein